MAALLQRALTVTSNDATAPSPDLPVTAYLVLGILAAYDEQLTAGEIKTRAEFSVGHFYWSPSVSHIRRELTKLLDRGHVSSHTAELGARTVTLFQATPGGEQALRAWVRCFPGSEQVMIKHPVILKNVVGNRVGRHRSDRGTWGPSGRHASSVGRPHLGAAAQRGDRGQRRLAASLRPGRAELLDSRTLRRDVEHRPTPRRDLERDRSRSARRVHRTKGTVRRRR